MPVFQPHSQFGSRRSVTRSIKWWGASGVFWLVLLLASLAWHKAVSLVVMDGVFLAASIAQVFYNARRLRHASQP